MAQPGNFTPILLYSSSTSTNVPLAANLTNSTNGAELAINIADKNLFFKDSGGTVNTVPIRQSGTSSNGWLSSTDWNTFNSKAPATSGTSLLYGNGSGGFSNVTIGSGISFAGGTLSATGTGGTVTSVTGTSPVVSSGGTTPAISLATAYGDTLNPYASKTANYILAAPNGSAGVPTFRALVAADIPSLSSIYIPYTGASSAIDLNAQTVTNIAHLGINTTSVPTILIRAIGDNNSSSRIAMRGYSSNTSSSSIRVTKFRGTFAAPQAPQSGDSLGKFELAGYGTTASDGYPQASYEGLATEAWGATARGTKVVFKVTPNTTTTQVTALTIDQDSTATFASTVTATSFSGSGASLTGVVTSVGATSPVTSSGGTTPTIAMPAATTSVSGYLTSTDWTTFNSKQPAGSYLTAVSVVSANGFAGTSSGGTTPALTLSTSITGLLKGNGTAISAATSGTDYAPATSGTSILYGNGAGGFSNVTIGTGLTFIGGTLASTASGGTVTSVAATVPAFLSISGSPITTSGTLAISYSGTALPVANGGTGQTSFTAGYVQFGNFVTDSNFIWENTNKALGISVAAPVAKLDISGSLGAANRAVKIKPAAEPATIDNLRTVAIERSGNDSTLVFGYATTPDAWVMSASYGSTGAYKPLAFATSDTERMRLDTSGNLLIGATSVYASSRLRVKSSGTSNATYNIELENSAGTVLMAVRDDGYFFTGQAAVSPYNVTTGSAANCYINSDGGLYRSTSSARYKTDITDATHGLAEVLKLRPVTYKGKGEVDADKVFGGLIAEEVDALGLTEFVQYTEDGVPDALAYSNMVSLCVKAIQELNNKFDAYVASHP